MALMTFENAVGECTFEAFLSILQREERGKYTVRELKAILVVKYTDLMRTHKVQVMQYYKHLTANRTVLAVNVDDFIMNSLHYMTHLDLWMLAQHFRVPVVLFSAQLQHPLVENKAPALLLYYGQERDDNAPKDASDVRAYFVMTLGRQRDVAPSYSVVRTDANDMKFSLGQCTNPGFVAEVMKQIMVIASKPPETDFVGEFIANYVPAKRVVLKEANE
jgi:hypothetical protein